MLVILKKQKAKTHLMFGFKLFDSRWLPLQKAPLKLSKSDIQNELYNNRHYFLPPQSYMTFTPLFAEQNSKKIKELQAELTAKEELITRKQAELSRANQKHYELEQELAFFKIDTKFTSLHQKPDTPSFVSAYSVFRFTFCTSSL